jgi:hypothetical protein
MISTILAAIWTLWAHVFLVLLEIPTLNVITTEGTFDAY